MEADGKNRWTDRCQIIDKIFVTNSVLIMGALDCDYKLSSICFFQVLWTVDLLFMRLKTGNTFTMHKKICPDQVLLKFRIR